MKRLFWIAPWFAPLLGLLPAHADPHPQFLPVHDVAVTYTLSAPGRPDTSYQLEYDAADQRARVNDPAHGTFFIIDLPAGSAQLVVPALHSVINAPNLSNLTRQIDDADNARFTPLGHATYAGLRCEKYLVLNAQGSGSACITPDGVILHFYGKDAHGSANVTATSVVYGPLPPGDFAPPDGFISMSLPPAALEQLLRQQ